MVTLRIISSDERFMVILSVEGVGKVYGKNWVALSNISFSLEEGEFAFLVGPSGSGKSTLISLILMKDKPDAGRIVVAGYSSAEITRHQMPAFRRRVGVIFQDFKLLPDLTAWQNVAFALRVSGMPRKFVRKRTEELLGLVGLVHKEKSYPHELSGGERQRIAIARALVHSPVLILADEPTGNLDPHSADQIMELLISINHHGTSVLMATHNTDLVEHFGFRVLELEEGVLVGDRPARKDKLKGD